VAKNLLKHGKTLLGLGYPIIPIRQGMKHPGLKGWQEFKADTALLDRWLNGSFNNNSGVGILCGTVSAVDIDVKDLDMVRGVVDYIAETIPSPVHRIGNFPKVALIYKTDTPFRKITSKKYIDLFGEDHKVEILGAGQQFVAYHIHPDTGQPYSYPHQELADTPLEDLPTITEEQARDIVLHFEHLAELAGWEPVEDGQSNAPSMSSDNALENAQPPMGFSEEEILKCLNTLDPDIRMSDWVKVGMGIYHETNGSADGFALWDEWSSNSHKYNEQEMQTRWDSFQANLNNTRPVTFATVFKWAKEAHKQAKLKKVKETGFGFTIEGDLIKNTPPIEWAIDTLLPLDTLGVIFGAPGSYKSFIALDMAFNVARGTPYHNLPTLQGSVFYIAGEGRHGLSKRIKALRREHNVPDSEVIPLFVSDDAAQLYEEISAEAVAESIESHAEVYGAPKIIVIDTLARNMGAADENSASDMGQFIHNVDTYLRAKFGTCCLLVHHSGHGNKTRARGSTALNAGVDLSYLVDRKEGTDRALLKCTKMKDTEEPEDRWFEAKKIDLTPFDEVEKEISSLVMLASEAPVVEEKTVLKGKQLSLFTLVAQEGPNVERDTVVALALEEEMFASGKQVRDAIYRLKSKGLLIINDDKLTANEVF